MVKLEPCPCCGGEGRLKDVLGRKIRQGWVGCPACGLYIGWKISPDGAVRKWNKRARPIPAPEPFTNADALARMFREHLADWLDVTDDGLDLAELYCIPAQCPVEGDGEVPADACRACLTRFLALPFTGDFGMEDGHFIVGREARA